MRYRRKAVTSPDANMVRKKVQLLTASCREPLMPWPLVQPSASLAPKIRMAPPRKAPASRFHTDGPNLCLQTDGTASSLNLPATIALIMAPKKLPSTKRLP